MFLRFRESVTANPYIQGVLKYFGFFIFMCFEAFGIYSTNPNLGSFTPV